MNSVLEQAPHKANASNIARHLTEAITSGHFAVGDLLPTELELCKHYGASRYTVRAALAELQQFGLVSRRKNVGTRVVSAKPRAAFRPSLASVDDLVQFGEEHLRVVQSVATETIHGDLAKELGCGDGTSWLRISTLRMVEGEDAMPIGWTDVYIDPAYAEIEELVKASPGALISSLIEERYDRQIAEIQQEVRAFTITDEVLASRLQVQSGASALKIVRRYFDAEGELFEVSVSVHPADRFSVSMRLRR
ncbi:GntR family transcriptional regulator [Variovorax sp. YR216]|uniref:GntR family transcriptional regulator n=1 Tax=Variovorax sp. YR216 TaxID=1882828 RepID=UPI00089B3E02|nr:GntR family transcriptional regulator [Variovorax sp. YR216]SEB19335.1 DNA-binding transcriptional regulator, GntR family [Variovorax sp. YR216]